MKHEARVLSLATVNLRLLMSTDNWIINDIRVGNAVQPSGEVPKDEPTAYHSPRLKRTIMGGPGNHSSIIDCSCGARFDGVYEYLGHDRRMCDWYARHAGIGGGGDAVAKILRQYDKALDAIDYPEHPRARVKRLPGNARRAARQTFNQTAAAGNLNAVDPTAVLDTLRTELESA